jgi:hypothetical protein
MDHDYIEQSDLVNRYLMSRMPAEESERFEEHFIDCPQCIDKLKTTRDFKQGLRLLTAQQLSQRESHSKKVLRWPFSERISWKVLTLAACCLLIAAVTGSILLVGQARRLRQEANEARNDSSEWQRRYEEQQQAALSSEQQRQEAEQSLKAQVSQLQTELLNEQEQRAESAGAIQGWTQPGINIPIVVLNSVRGGGQNATADVSEINLSHAPMNFVMSVSLEGEAKFKSYHVTIQAGNRPFWNRAGFKPDRYNALTMSFNSTFFRPGDYLLVVKGAESARDSGIVGNYPFRIVKRP